MDEEPAAGPDPVDAGVFRSGLATLLGRPNVGKSTLLNRLVGRKVSIVSDKPQTTRYRVHGVLDRPGAQVVLVDTPGLHRPRTALGERLNKTARAAVADVDVVIVVIDATMPLGPGDRVALAAAGPAATVAVNKIDRARPAEVLGQLAAAAALGATECFPLSARTGEGVDALVDHLVASLPPGPRYYPEGHVSDVPEARWLAELVREKLLAVTHDELPHSIATRVTEWEWPYVRCEIVVERESQKGIVIGRGGTRLREVGVAVRAELDPRLYLDLHVVVERDWQRHLRALDRLGY